MSINLRLTPNEAGFILGWQPKAINKEIDLGIIPQSDLPKAGGKMMRYLANTQLRYMALAVELHNDLKPAGRKRLYGAVKRTPRDSHIVNMGNLVLDLSAIDNRISVGVARLDNLKTAIVAKDGDAFFKGTNISAYMVAQLSPSQTLDEIAEDYPSLSREQIQAAIDYAKVSPKLGRPYPKRSMKRALAEMAAAGVFDPLEIDVEARAPA